MSDYQTIGVIGAGAWGTALAQTAAKAGRDVILWSFEQDVADAINTKHQNTIYLPEVTLEPSIEAVTAMSDLDACEAVLAVAPAHHEARSVSPAVSCGARARAQCRTSSRSDLGR